MTIAELLLDMRLHRGDLRIMYGRDLDKDLETMLLDRLVRDWYAGSDPGFLQDMIKTHGKKHTNFESAQLLLRRLNEWD